MIAVKTKTTEKPTAAGRALIRAADEARKAARRFGTPVYVSRNGKVVAMKP